MPAETNLLEAALNYLGRGWSAIPLNHKKQPLLSEWTTYQKRLPTENEVRGLLEKNYQGLVNELSRLAGRIEVR